MVEVASGHISRGDFSSHDIVFADRFISVAQDALDFASMTGIQDYDAAGVSGHSDPIGGHAHISGGLLQHAIGLAGQHIAVFGQTHIQGLPAAVHREAQAVGVVQRARDDSGRACQLLGGDSKCSV